MKKEKKSRAGLRQVWPMQRSSILIRRRLRRPKRPEWVKPAVGEKGKEAGGMEQTRVGQGLQVDVRMSISGYSPRVQ